jgi:hypothetical protein
VGLISDCVQWVADHSQGVLLRDSEVLMNLFNAVRFEVLTAVDVKSSILWDITTCSPFEVNRCFGGIFRLHLLLGTCFVLLSACLIFRP